MCKRYITGKDQLMFLHKYYETKKIYISNSIYLIEHDSDKLPLKQIVHRMLIDFFYLY